MAADSNIYGIGVITYNTSCDPHAPPPPPPEPIVITETKVVTETETVVETKYINNTVNHTNTVYVPKVITNTVVEKEEVIKEVKVNELSETSVALSVIFPVLLIICCMCFGMCCFVANKRHKAQMLEIERKYPPKAPKTAEVATEPEVADHKVEMTEDIGGLSNAEI